MKIFTSSQLVNISQPEHRRGNYPEGKVVKIFGKFFEYFFFFLVLCAAHSALRYVVYIFFDWRRKKSEKKNFALFVTTLRSLMTQITQIFALSLSFLTLSLEAENSNVFKQKEKLGKFSHSHTHTYIRTRIGGWRKVETSVWKTIYLSKSAKKALRCEHGENLDNLWLRWLTIALRMCGMRFSIWFSTCFPSILQLESSVFPVLIIVSVHTLCTTLHAKTFRLFVEVIDPLDDAAAAWMCQPRNSAEFFSAHVWYESEENKQHENKIGIWQENSTNKKQPWKVFSGFVHKNIIVVIFLLFHLALECRVNSLCFDTFDIW